MQEQALMGSCPSYDTMANRTSKKVARKAARKATTRTALTGPRVIVVPPGPKSKAALQRKEQFVTTGLRVGLPLELTRAEGPYVQDADGNVYVDLGVGIGVHNAGHRPPEVIRAAKAQLDKLTHICYMVSTYGPYTDLAEVMAEICPPGLTQSIFLNSGSEAIENAVKIARAYTKKPWIVAFRTAFHGRTLLDISLTGKEKPYREGFGPLVREVLITDYAYPYRDPEARSPTECAKARVEEIEAAITKPEVEGQVGMIVAEPVQGEGGIIVPPKEFFPLLRKLCDDYGMLLIDDEVQAGMGRTGRLWAIDNWDTVPDLLVSGKALGGGLPLGGVTGKVEIMEAPGPASLGGTFGGNPVVCAAALEAVKVIQKALPKVPRLEALMDKRLREIFESHERVGEVRGLGAMWALEFVKDRKTKEPDNDLARAVQLAGLRNGLMLLTAGYYSNCIRLLPPLNIPRPLMDKAFDLLEDSIDIALAGKVG
jgi:4-aminobutyrate aminotransferase/(S)-3-amino-2-methylpropionate transaminase